MNVEVVWSVLIPVRGHHALGKLSYWCTWYWILSFLCYTYLGTVSSLSILFSITEEVRMKGDIKNSLFGKLTFINDKKKVFVTWGHMVRNTYEENVKE